MDGHHSAERAPGYAGIGALTTVATIPNVPPAGHLAGYRRIVPQESIVPWLREAAEFYADQPAVFGQDAVVSYRELEHRVAALAAALRDRGANRGDLIAVSTSRSVDLLAATLAILRINAVICPVDLGQAPERTRQMLARLRPRMILVDDGEITTIPGAVSVSALAWQRAGDEAPSLSGEADPGGQDLAYVEPTSGSTGQPKAVAVPHRALANLIAWTQRRYPIGVGDTLIYAGSLAYDIWFWDILASLCFGAAIALAPPGIEAEPARLAEFISASRVSALHFTPSLLTEFLAAAEPAQLTSVRYAFCGGERLHADLARQMLASIPGRLFNRYGPTETCIYVIDHEVSEQDLASESVPIGRPIWGVTARVLDSHGLQVPQGQPGILHVGGTCLAWGYLRAGARTAEAFIPDPWSEDPGARMYRTGDVVRQRPDGLFEFLGRADDEVKIRGVRVKLAEIEYALLRLPAVKAAAVTAAGDPRQPTLVAHLVDAGSSDDELRSFLADQLPLAAIPARFIRRPSLPKLANGKTDRASLSDAALFDDQAAVPGAAPPLTQTEQQVAEIWSEVLGVESVGRKGHFFELGGQSLLAMRMIVRIRRKFGIRIPVRAIFDAPNVESFSALLDKMLQARASATR